MENKNLIIKEIKKGELGTGLLIENDGYIKLDDKYNKQLYEDIRSHQEQDNGFYIPKPFVVSAIFQKCGIENANGRIYPEEVLKREIEKFQKRIAERTAIGELNHPEQPIIDLERVAIIVTEVHWEGHTVIGKAEIPVSEGYRKFGVCSCKADEAANLLMNNILIGVSSRGLGTVSNTYGKTIVNDDYELVCFDVVSEPSTPGAYIKHDEEQLKQYVETQVKEGEILTDKLKYFSNLL